MSSEIKETCSTEILVSPTMLQPVYSPYRHGVECLFVFWPDSAYCLFLQCHFDTLSCQIRTRTQHATAMELSKRTGPTEIMFDSTTSKKPRHPSKKLHDQRRTKLNQFTNAITLYLEQIPTSK